MKATPLVSVNMPVYNGERFIKEAIESILAQSFADFELVIVNDGSTDNTVSIIGQFNDPRIKLVHNKNKTGLAHVRNIALTNSIGKYIAILDSDDVAFPERLQLQVDFLEKNEKYALVCGGIDIIDAEGNITGAEAYTYSDDEIGPALFFHNCIAQSSVMLRKSMLPSTEPYDPAFPPSEDYHLWIRLSKKYPMHIIKKPLIKYRKHAFNTSSERKEHTDNMVSKVLKLQCDELGLTYLTKDDLGLILALVYDCYNGERAFVASLNKLYQEIIKANRKHKRYPAPIFEKLIKGYMNKTLPLFFVRKRYGSQELKDLFGTSVNAAFYLPAGRLVKLIAKCMIYYKTRRLSNNNK